jgi:hypothetical protein
VLADPSHPELVTHLRAAAAAICHKKRHDLRLWLEGGLFTHLLGILTALPALGLSPTPAAKLCADASAVVCDIMELSTEADVVLPASLTFGALLTNLAQREVLSAVVDCGIAIPAAARQLPHGREARASGSAHRGPRPLDAAGVGAGAEEAVQALLEAPRTKCLVLVASVMQVHGPSASAELYQGVLEKLVEPGIFEHLLDMAIHHRLNGALILTTMPVSGVLSFQIKAASQLLPKRVYSGVALLDVSACTTTPIVAPIIACSCVGQARHRGPGGRHGAACRLRSRRVPAPSTISPTASWYRLGRPAGGGCPMLAGNAAAQPALPCC